MKTFLLLTTAALLTSTAAMAETTVVKGDATTTTAIAPDGTQTTVVVPDATASNPDSTTVVQKSVGADGSQTTTTQTQTTTVGAAAVTTDTNTAPASTAATTTTTTGTDSSGVAVASASPSGLSTYDTNNDGSLTPLEFGQMVASMQAPAAGGVTAASRERYSKKSNNAATDLINSTQPMFAKADTNHDMRVSADELGAWQAAGMPAS